MKTTYRALAVVGLMAATATAASAATFNLADQTRYSTSSFSVSNSGITMTVTGRSPTGNTVRTDNGYGLSVGDHLIDGAQGVERAILSFSQNVTLASFLAGYADRYDDYAIDGWNGSGWTQLQVGRMSGGGDNSSHFLVSTIGSAAAFVSNMFRISTRDYGDEFKIRNVTAMPVSEVPLPASGLLLLGALGALGLRRRKA